MRTLALYCLRRSKRSLGHNPTKLYIARNLKAAREIIFRRPIFIKSSLYFQQTLAPSNRVHRLRHTLCAGISKAMTGKVKAGDFVKFAAEQVGGKSGGRLGLEQVGGTDTAKLPEEDWLSGKLV